MLIICSDCFIHEAVTVSYFEIACKITHFRKYNEKYLLFSYDSCIFAHILMTITMKKILITIFSLIVVNGLIGCGGNDGKAGGEEAELAFDSIIKDTTVNLTNGDNSPKAEIHLNIQYATGKNSTMVNDTLFRSGILTPDYLSASTKSLDPVLAIDSFIIKYVTDYRQDFGRLYAVDHEHSTAYNLQYSCNTKIQKKRKGVVNYIAEVYSYSGGAHGINMTIIKNINQETGKVLKLNDVFVPGYEQTLNDLIVAKLCKNYEAEDLKGLQEKGIFVGMDPYVTENFILDDDEVVFVYCDSEIAPHAMGEISVVIDNKELKSILSNQ